MTDVAIAFVDVGQGDCTIAVDRDEGAALLVDCPAGMHGTALSTLASLGATRVDLAVASHQHLDHLGGLYSTVTAFPTSVFSLNTATNVPADPDERKKLRAALRAIKGLPRQGIAIDEPRRGTTGFVGSLSWEVLAPDLEQLLHAQAQSRPNHASVVMKLSLAGHTVLLGTDADAESWEAMSKSGLDLTADVFQLPHHGGELSGPKGHMTIDVLLDLVQASLHMISIGSENTYGHPAASTVTAIRARGDSAQTYCTQLNSICAAGSLGKAVPCAGTTILTFDGERMEATRSVSDHRRLVRRLPNAQCV
jgi:competence protein ComEC